MAGVDEAQAYPTPARKPSVGLPLTAGRQACRLRRDGCRYCRSIDQGTAWALVSGGSVASLHGSGLKSGAHW